MTLVFMFAGADSALATANLGAPAINQVKQKADDVEPPAALATGIPIYDSQSAARSNPVVVYSVKVPNLSSGEALRIDGSNHMSYCAPSDIQPGSGNAGSPCKGLTGAPAPDPYSYDVHLEIHAYQANSPTAPSDGQHWIANSERLCTPAFHHCAFTVKNKVSGLSVANGQYIAQEVAAWTDSSAWESGQMIELEGNCINGTGYGNCDPQPNDDQRSLSKGQLSVIRTGSKYTGTHALPTDTTFKQPYIEINTSGHDKRQVVYSRAIANLAAGEVIEASGGMQLDGTQPCDPDPCTKKGSPDPSYVFHRDVQGYWLLATSPTQKRAAPDERYPSATDIQNCQSADGTQGGLCRLFMLGSVTAPVPPPDHIMFLNFVAWAKDKSQEGPSTNGVTPKVKLSQGQFDITRFPAATSPITHPTKFKRFKFVSKGGGRFKGRIASPKSKCLGGRTVKLIRAHNGHRHQVGRDNTSGTGGFTINPRGSRVRKGRYHAQVAKKAFDGGAQVCQGAVSSSVRVT